MQIKIWYLYQLYEDAMTAAQELNPKQARYELSHLAPLEAEAIHIIRKWPRSSSGRCCCSPAARTPSSCCIWLSRRSSRAACRFPVMHVDTGHNFDEVLQTRDELVQEAGVRLIVAPVPAASTRPGGRSRRATRCRR